MTADLQGAVQHVAPRCHGKQAPGRGAQDVGWVHTPAEELLKFGELEAVAIMHVRADEFLTELRQSRARLSVGSMQQTIRTRGGREGIFINQEPCVQGLQPKA